MIGFSFEWYFVVLVQFSERFLNVPSFECISVASVVLAVVYYSTGKIDSEGVDP